MHACVVGVCAISRLSGVKRTSFPQPSTSLSLRVLFTWYLLISLYLLHCSGSISISNCYRALRSTWEFKSNTCINRLYNDWRGFLHITKWIMHSVRAYWLKIRNIRFGLFHCDFIVFFALSLYLQAKLVFDTWSYRPIPFGVFQSNNRCFAVGFSCAMCECAYNRGVNMLFNRISSGCERRATCKTASASGYLMARTSQ